MPPADTYLKELGFAYRAWSRYEDTGFVEYEQPGISDPARLEFSTRFQAPADFQCRFQHEDGGLAYELKHGVGGTTVRRGANVERYETIRAATATLAGVSTGVVRTIPSLLMWQDLADGWSVTALAAAEILPDSAVDEKPCCRIQGTHPWQQVRMEIFAEKRRYLIRRIIETQVVDGRAIRIFTTHYPDVAI